MYKRIAIIQGHPDPDEVHFGHRLAVEYAQSAIDEGCDVETVNVAKLQFPLLRSQSAWETQRVPASLLAAQNALKWAEHWVLFFPLWLGDMPALTKGFFEQVLRPGFAFSEGTRGPSAEKLLAGKTARLVVTMGMPAAMYRWYFRAHSVKSLERNILGYCGITRVDETLIGAVGEMSEAKAKHWFRKMRALGKAAH